MASDKEIPTGQQKPSSTWGEFNNIAFMVQQAIGKLQTATLVKIEKCTNAGDLSPVGFVDVTPLVNQLDAAGNPTPHVTIFNVPYFRLQGGKNAIIIDPEPGDIGVAVFASRDLTKVKATKAAANPGSFRQYSFADGLYLGGMLNAVPEQYVQFNSAGIKIHSPTLINLEAPDIQLNADTVEINAGTSTTITTPAFTLNASGHATVNTPTFTVNGASVLNGPISQTGGGAASFSGSATFVGNVTAQGTSVHTHTHSGVQPGGGNTGAPN